MRARFRPDQVVRCWLILAAVAATLTGCSAPSEAELLKYAESAEGVVGENRIDEVEFLTDDGWDGGVEGHVRYRICGADAASRESCETKEVPASFQRNSQGEWKPVPLDR